MRPVSNALPRWGGGCDALNNANFGDPNGVLTDGLQLAAKDTHVFRINPFVFPTQQVTPSTGVSGHADSTC